MAKRQKRDRPNDSRQAGSNPPASAADSPSSDQPKKKRRRRRKPKNPETAPSDDQAADEAVASGESNRAAEAKQDAEDRDSPRRPASDISNKSGNASLPAESGFLAMGLSESTLNALAAAEYMEPSPIQAGLIPVALKQVDVMGQARTGTGKTAAFALPILERVEPGGRGASPGALVLAPTRELAVQVRDECEKLARGSGRVIVAVYGGKPIRQQTEQLRRGADVVVGTPGRVLDLMARGTLRLDELEIVVLDEADRMLDIGFRPDIEKILRRAPSDRQTLLLSATIPASVERLARKYMRDPEKLDFSPKDLAVETIEQFYFSVDPQRKFDLLVSLLQREDPRQAIVFCRTKRGTDRIYRRLHRKFKSVDVIHGDLAQSARDRVMRSFRAGDTKILAATDVVGRGIDVTTISHIINYDIPQFCDDYVHRVGRTGRMGREGVAYTFVTPEEGNELTRIEVRINLLLKRDHIEGFDALEKPKEQEPGSPLPEPPAPKPVYGKRSKRYRRAL